MPDNTQSEVQESAETQQETLSFADNVNKIAGQLIQGEDGVYQLPDGLDLDEPTATAVMIEKRRRDADSTIGKARHKQKILEAENEELRKRMAQSFKPDITADEQQELEDLKFSDPDAWRSKMNDLELSARATLDEQFTQVTTEASVSAEIARREQVLADFQTANPDIVVTEEVLANDVPPRITRKLEAGDVSFEEFLADAVSYLSKGKVVKDTSPVTNKPNLSDAGGGASPDQHAVSEDIVSSYARELY